MDDAAAAPQIDAVTWWRLCFERARRQYDVGLVRDHQCSSSTRTDVDVAQNWYGCTVCGRLHQCDGRPEHACAVWCSRETQDAPVCIFSGRQVEAPMTVPGTFDREVEVRTNRGNYLSGDVTSGLYVRTEQARVYAHRANVFDGARRNRENHKADVVKAMTRGVRRRARAPPDTARAGEEDQVAGGQGSRLAQTQARCDGAGTGSRTHGR